MKLVLAGVPVGLLAILLGLGLAGGGHGWVSAFFASLILPLAYPLALWRCLSARNPRLDWTPATAALVADIWLVHATCGERDYVARMWQSAADLMVIWFVVWFGWQALAVMAVARRR